MDRTAFLTSDLLANASRTKRQAMASANFIKSGKLKKYLDLLTSMVDGEVITEPWAFLSGVMIYLNMRVNDLDSFKGERIQGILTSLEYLNPTDQSVTDYAEFFNKEFIYHFKHIVNDNDIAVTVRICIDARVKHDSPTCKRVVTGYKPASDPTPIYGIVCDDEVPPDNEPNGEPAAYISPSTEGY